MNESSFREFVDKLSEVDKIGAPKPGHRGVEKFFKTFILTRWWFSPYVCPKCGRDYKRVDFSDLEPNVQKEHIRAETDWVFYCGYVYTCDCGAIKDGKNAKLIMYN